MFGKKPLSGFFLCLTLFLSSSLSPLPDSGKSSSTLFLLTSGNPFTAVYYSCEKIQEHLPLFPPHPQTLRINKASENEWEERESLTNDVSTWAKFPIIDTIGNYSTDSSPSKWARMFELDRLPLTWLLRRAWGQRSPRRPHGNQGNLAFDTRSVFRGNGSNLWCGKEGLYCLLHGL